MSYSDRQFEYEDRNQARFRSLAIHILEHNVQEGTMEIISILEKEKQAYKEIHDPEEKQAAVRIYNQTEKLAYLEFIDREIEHHRELLNWPSSASQTAQGNEPQTTGESTQVEKINWEAGLAELAFMFDILFKNPEIGCSMNQYKSRWALIAKHFTVKGEEITSEGLRHAFSQLKINKNEGKPAKHEMYETLLKLSQEIED